MREAKSVMSMAQAADGQHQNPSDQTEKEWFSPDPFEHAPLPYQVLDEHGRILRVNLAWIELFGCQQDEAEGRLFSDFLTGDTNSFLTHFTEVIRNGSVGRFECEVSTIRGQTITLALDGKVITHQRGGKCRVFCLLRDITRKKFEEKAIERAKREWEHAFDAVPDLVAILDTQYHIIRLNKPMAARLGLDVRDAVGLTCYEVVHGTSTPPPFCPHHRLLEDCQEHGAEMTDPALGGTFLVTASPIFDSDGSLIGSVHVARDITDRKRAEEALKKAHEELEQRVQERTAELFEVNKRLEEQLKTIDQLYEHIVQSGKAKAIADYTQRVAHELRQPLAVIGGFARRLARKTCGEKTHAENHEFEIIVREVERLERILGELIEFGHHEQVGLGPVNPHELIEEILHINAPRLQSKQVKVDMNLTPRVGNICLDRDKFREVVRNLLAHAIERSPTGETISIDTGVYHLREKVQETGKLASRDYFELAIHTRGPALSREEQENLFNPFAMGKDYESGLCLTLAKKIVEDHHGSISVKSDHDGTVFTVWVPIAIGDVHPS